jgi:hypothetical protein
MNYRDYKDIKDMETMAEKLGFSVVSSKYQFADIALIPKRDDTHDCLPCYAPDTQFGYYGTVAGAMSFLVGWQAALEYVRVIGAADAKRIEKFEENYRQRKLIQIMKQEKPK